MSTPEQSILREIIIDSWLFEFHVFIGDRYLHEDEEYVACEKVPYLDREGEKIIFKKVPECAVIPPCKFIRPLI